MDALERLTVQMIENRSLESVDHLQRYELASALVEGCDVVDLGCGVGYGSAVLGRTASRVVGVDVSEEAIAEASHYYGRDNVEFLVADCHEYLKTIRQRRAAIVCFELLEHLDDPERLIPLLAARVEQGDVVVLSVPNSAIEVGDNKFHLTDFDLVSARAFYRQIGEHRLLAQFLAEGALIADAKSETLATRSSWVGEVDTEAASHFVAVFNYDGDELFFGDLQMIGRPQASRYVRQIEEANKSLRHANAMLFAELNAIAADREHAGAFGAASATRIVSARDGEIAALNERIEELNVMLTGMHESLSWRITRPLRDLKSRFKRDRS